MTLTLELSNTGEGDTFARGSCDDTSLVLRTIERIKSFTQGATLYSLQFATLHSLQLISLVDPKLTSPRLNSRCRT